MPSVRSVNKVILVGHIVRDAEVRFIPSGTAVCSFTIATNKGWKSQSGEYKDEASYHQISVWGKYGENVAKILTKGAQVYIEGELSYRTKRDDAGKFISKDVDIRANVITILSRNSGAADGGNGMQQAPVGGDINLDEVSKDMDKAKEKSSSQKGSESAVTDDDLPF